MPKLLITIQILYVVMHCVRPVSKNKGSQVPSLGSALFLNVSVTTYQGSRSSCYNKNVFAVFDKWVQLTNRFPYVETEQLYRLTSLCDILATE